MGRLLATALLVAAAGIAVIIVNGPGKDKPEDKDRFTPRAGSTRVSAAAAQGTIANASSPSSAPVGATIVMKGLRFVPTDATLRVGQAVRFVNKDNVAHTIIQDVGPRSGETTVFDSQRVLPGQAFTYVTRNTGTVRFICTLHPTVMSGVLTITVANS